MKFCMVVDDSDVIRKVSRRIFEDLRLVPVESETAGEALETCKTNMPDIILLDWQMPETDSIEVIREIRALEDGDRPHIVYCTTENDTKSISSAFSAGASAYLMKPFDRDSVYDKLSEFGLVRQM